MRRRVGASAPALASFTAAVVGRSAASGNLLHDAHIAALCIEHGVAELITGDRDFRRFEGLRLHDPFGAG